MAVTEKSWHTVRADSEPSGRDDFYRSAATLLIEQARYRRREPRASKPPLASAFVTSFDLELEMALLSAPDAEPFVVAMPVNLLVGYPGHGRPRRALTCWLGCTVYPDHKLDPQAQLSRLLRPDEWFLMSDPRFAVRAHADMPLVVRLNGCPLIEWPKNWLEDEKFRPVRQAILELFAKGGFDYDEEAGLPLELSHAVLIDEYVSMQQAAVELFVSTKSGEVDDKVRYGLPEPITGVPNDTFARFWMVLGVQVGDSSVRYRFATQVASPALLDPRSGDPVDPEHSGVVVNWRTDAMVRDLLAWYGFDVILGDCQAHRQDLDHYIRHLQEPSKRASPNQRCPLS
jgi:hypothetical protein